MDAPGDAVRTPDRFVPALTAWQDRENAVRIRTIAPRQLSRKLDFVRISKYNRLLRLMTLSLLRDFERRKA